MSKQVRHTFLCSFLFFSHCLAWKFFFCCLVNLKDGPCLLRSNFWLAFDVRNSLHYFVSDGVIHFFLHWFGSFFIRFCVFSSHFFVHFVANSRPEIFSLSFSLCEQDYSGHEMYNFDMSAFTHLFFELQTKSYQERV